MHTHTYTHTVSETLPSVSSGFEKSRSKKMFGGGGGGGSTSKVCPAYPVMTKPPRAIGLSLSSATCCSASATLSRC